MREGCGLEHVFFWNTVSEETVFLKACGSTNSKCSKYSKCKNSAVSTVSKGSKYSKCSKCATLTSGPREGLGGHWATKLNPRRSKDEAQTWDAVKTMDHLRIRIQHLQMADPNLSRV